jgi:nicotinate phosphoribosyltransferase
MPRRKRSEGKATWPGRKQVFRRYDRAGRILGYTLALEGERLRGEPLLRPFMRGGERLDPPLGLPEAREHAARSLASLPPHLRALEPAAPFAPEVTPALRELAGRLDALA